MPETLGHGDYAGANERPDDADLPPSDASKLVSNRAIVING
jgi:hypothetical protein